MQLSDLKVHAQGLRPRVLVFDVNETLLDIESMNPLFSRIFGNQLVLREWFGQLVMISIATTLLGRYADYFSLGVGVLQMLGDIHGKPVSSNDIEELRAALLNMPAHQDVAPGLQDLKNQGFRLVSLTNSPPNPAGKSPLENAGLGEFFERQFSVQTVRAFKPAKECYHMVSESLGVAPPECCMVACHVWDTIGAQSAGFRAALITRPGNASLPVAGLPQPDLVAGSIAGLASQLISNRHHFQD